MIKKDFLRCFTLLENEFGKQNEIMKNGWYKMFGIYKVGELEEAVKHYLKKIKEFPYPSEILEDVEWIIKCKKEKSYWQAVRISNRKE